MTNFTHNNYRQKAHLQRHETTHGVGVKVSRGSTSAARRKRKRSRAASSSGGGVAATTSTIVTTQQQPQNAALSVNLQQRLARVSEQFGSGTTGGAFTKASDGTEDDEDDEDLAVNHGDGTLKSYSKVCNHITQPLSLMTTFQSFLHREKHLLRTKAKKMKMMKMACVKAKPL